MTLNECRGIYRVLWLWRAGSLFLVFRWRVTSPSVCSERGLWDWGSQWNFHGAIAIAKSLFLEAIEGSQHHLYVCSKRMILHLWKFSTFHRCHRCALASFPSACLGDAEDALTMIASFMKQIVFRGQFRVAWGTVCHQDAFATSDVAAVT